MVSHRIRGKSAPRGRSPNPKELKRVAKATKHRSKSSRSGKEGKEGKEGRGGYVTPPVKPSARSVSSGSTTKPRKLSFGQNSVHEIDAENEPGKKGFKEDVDMKSSKAEAIIQSMKKELVGLLNNET